MNGELIGAPAPPNGHKKQRTYFRTITILVNKPERSYLEITPSRVILDGGDRLVLPCNQSVVVGSRGLEVSVSANANVTVTIQGTIAFVILIHLYKKPAPYQRDHLGFYISNSKGLSGNCHGLLGRRLLFLTLGAGDRVQLPKAKLTLPMSLAGWRNSVGMWCAYTCIWIMKIVFLAC